jgi:hypothetical protein
MTGYQSILQPYRSRLSRITMTGRRMTTGGQNNSLISNYTFWMEKEGWKPFRNASDKKAETIWRDFSIEGKTFFPHFTEGIIV